MLPRLARVVTQTSKLRSLTTNGSMKNLSFFSRYGYATVAPAAADPPPKKDFPSKSPINLDKMFWSKPCSLALPKDSPLRIDEPDYVGIRRFILKLMMFYSKQSMSIRGANVIYKRIIAQVDKPAIYDVFNLEKTFKITFSLLVLHMWLVLRRLKEDGQEGVDLGQYVYEIYNHDVELRVSKAGVNLLLAKWMKELERIFYGNVVAYDAALLPEAKPNELQIKLWRNVFSDDGTTTPDNTDLKAAQAMARYVRRELGSLSLTDNESIFSGNFSFTPLENKPL
ncbi:ubiquinol-cytochrome C chaperone family protein [Arabidopsis lyrata subsp. lyrata]|uniref:Ubiquinol-cytochrome C chaperone family protein n=1 Tax=Arabidopsis lyrata subsp. lyrata TaxID=81972 RepID=D7MQY5_ARALL|nr:ubiquinol-cytochrome-c reductase complex assembly factor 1 [Arabidopsis lyrata subsp. lyrata]EFH42106.1 ubiquinol-cytochrome C chaperone family protein [Arabidopsis lyrata subsp. lyrata]|eukprot:XP_002865847.1 ubiquinol-cytochrome-c reductase complex assembly factor 1 [Arabidopsis lyrata subsp. lyrata]